MRFSGPLDDPVGGGSVVAATASVASSGRAASSVVVGVEAAVENLLEDLVFFSPAEKGNYPFLLRVRRGLLAWLIVAAPNLH